MINFSASRIFVTWLKIIPFARIAPESWSAIMSEFHSGSAAFVASRTVTTEKKRRSKKNIHITVRVTEEKQNDSRAICFFLFFVGFCWILLMCVKGIPSFSDEGKHVFQQDGQWGGGEMLYWGNMCGATLCCPKYVSLWLGGAKRSTRGPGQLMATPVFSCGTVAAVHSLVQIVVATA